MKNKVIKKIEKLQKSLETHPTPFKEVFFLTTIPGAPEHIKYRYYAKFDNKRINTVGLECVTEIDGDLINFKDIFLVKTDTISTAHPEIANHVELFAELVTLKPASVVFK